MELVLIRADWEEEMARSYFYWTPLSSVALSAEYLYERFKRNNDVFGTESIALLNTHRLPLSISYFLSCGGFVRLKGTYVHQAGRFATSTGPRRNDYIISPGEDGFGIFDIGVGYRLPKRYGMATLEVKNLFEKKFRFQDTDPSQPSIAPERMILFRFTANL
jgi:outer membrane receptor protein involved in Fe transport